MFKVMMSQLLTLRGRPIREKRPGRSIGVGSAMPARVRVKDASVVASFEFECMTSGRPAVWHANADA
jgi:hypothetical protein